MKFYTKHKKKIMWSLLTILAIILLQILLPYFIGLSAPKIQDEVGAIKIVTYNVELGLDQDTIGLLAEIDADIIALQEAYQIVYNNSIATVDELASILACDYYASSEGYNQDIYGLLILSKYEIINASFTKLPQVKYASPRGFFTAKIDVNSTVVTVITTHLNLPIAYVNRIKQVNQIIDSIDFSQPTILLGDFNTPNWITDIAYWKLFTTFNDGWIAAGNPSFTGKTWSSSFPVVRIDYIWTNDYCLIIKNSAELIRNPESSDHSGLAIKVKFKQ